jgi:alanine dehydrogenase
MKTAIITSSQIREAFAIQDYISAVENAFRLYGEGKVQMPAKVYLTFEKGDLRCMPAYMPDLNIAGVKLVNVHPGNKDLPSVMATIALFDPENGFPVAIMDGTHITNMRTGAAGALAAKYLSREDSGTAAFIGAGAQARTQLDGLRMVRPGISKITVFDLSDEHTQGFVEHAKRLGLAAEKAASVEEAVKEADIVTTTTPSREPIVNSVKQGTHVNAIGADAEGKQELSAEILKQATVVIDDWEQASHCGEINVALSKGDISKEDIHASLGEIVTGKKPAREYAEQITVFDSTGLAIQDISSAAEIFRRLKPKLTLSFDD